MPLTIVLAGALLVAAWLAPNHYPPWLAAHSDVMAAFAACCFLAATVWPGKRAEASTYGIARPALYFAVLAAVPLLQWAFGLVTFFGDAWISALYLFAAALVVQAALTQETGFPDRAVDTLAAALLVGAVAVAFILFLQRASLSLGPLDLFLVSVQPGRPPTGSFSQPNQSASLMALGLVALAYTHERGRVRVSIAVVLAIILILAQAVTLSRAQGLLWICAIATFAFVGRRVSMKTRTSVVVCGAVLWVLTYYAWTQIPFVDSLAESGRILELRMQAGPRTTMWRQLFQAAWEAPWLGWGWGQVSVAQMGVAADFPGSRMTEHSHNLLLDMALWNGLPLAGAFLAAAAIWLWQACRAVKDAGGVFCLLVVLLFLTHSMVEFPLDYLYYLVPFAIAVGVLEHRIGAAITLHGRRNFVQRSMLALAVLSPPVAVATAVDYWRIEASYREMRFTVARIGVPTANVDDLQPTLFDQLAVRYRLPLLMPDRNMSIETLQWYRAVVHRYPHPLFLHRYVVAQGLNGDAAGAKATLLALRNLHGERPYRESCDELRRFSQDKYPELVSIECRP